MPLFGFVLGCYGKCDGIVIRDASADWGHFTLNGFELFVCGSACRIASVESLVNKAITVVEREKGLGNFQESIFYKDVVLEFFYEVVIADVPMMYNDFILVDRSCEFVLYGFSNVEVTQEVRRSGVVKVVTNNVNLLHFFIDACGVRSRFFFKRCPVPDTFEN